MTSVSKRKRLRSRVGAGCVHPVRYKGKITAWRGLASYQDPQTGQQRRKSVTRKTRAAARTALKALIATLPKAPRASHHKFEFAALPPANDVESVLAFLHRWLNFKARDVRPATYRSYVQTLNHLVPHLGQAELTSLTAMRVEDAVGALLAEGRSLKTAASALHTLRMALRQAVRWGVLERNVAEQVRRPRTAASELSVWTPEQAQTFLAVAQGHAQRRVVGVALGGRAF